MKTIISTLVLLSILTGCGGAAVIKEDEAKVRAQPTEAMIPCSKPLPLTDKTLGGVVEKLKQSIQDLGDCSIKQKELKAWIEGS